MTRESFLGDCSSKEGDLGHKATQFLEPGIRPARRDIICSVQNAIEKEGNTVHASSMMA